jgi:DNA-binding LytR/AlgR family response regulator
MQILIIEDEPRAANRLQRLILQLDPGLEVLAKIGTVREAIDWLSVNAAPDLIFMDVRLTDGECFEILDAVVVESPIVFSTAYSEYALQAFAVNSIDYLLKPVVLADLKRALDKYRKLLGYRMSPDAWPDFQAKPLPTLYQQQFLVTIGGRFVPVKTTDLIAAKSYMKATQLIDGAGREWLLDKSLTDVTGSLDPTMFFQVSRRWLVRLSEIKELQRGREGYTIELPGLPDSIKVSRARVAALKRLLS